MKSVPDDCLSPVTRKIPQLDAVRGIAILLVIIHNTDSFRSLHLGVISAYGWMGVDLFFVLSGFLITGILLDTKKSDGYFKISTLAGASGSGRFIIASLSLCS